MKYIVHQRFRGTCLCGAVNLPALTVGECRGGIIYVGGRPVCLASSEVAHQHFSPDNDGKGLRRGKLTQAIQKALAKRDAGYQTRWDKVWANPICQPYKRTEYGDYWLWNHDFFCASISDLEHIARLIGVKEAV